MQFVIMFTPVRSFFKVDTIPWEGWIDSILVGAGSLPVSFIVKFITRLATFEPLPSCFGACKKTPPKLVAFHASQLATNRAQP